MWFTRAVSTVAGTVVVYQPVVLCPGKERIWPVSLTRAEDCSAQPSARDSLASCAKQMVESKKLKENESKSNRADMTLLTGSLRKIDAGGPSIIGLRVKLCLERPSKILMCPLPRLGEKRVGSFIIEVPALQSAVSEKTT